ncbi:MAG: hypothetical protein WDM70_05570 [Nitrosomonadales bacterium]
MSRLAKHVTSLENRAGTACLCREKSGGSSTLANVTLVQGDAAQGWTGKYDVIVLTGSVPVLPEAFQNSLKPDGRLFAIVGDAPAMHARLIYPRGAGQIQQRDPV